LADLKCSQNYTLYQITLIITKYEKSR